MNQTPSSDSVSSRVIGGLLGYLQENRATYYQGIWGFGAIISYLALGMLDRLEWSVNAVA